MRWIFGILSALGIASPLSAQDVAAYSFVWQGGGGYTVQGGLAFDAALLGTGLVTQEDVICFAIEGIKDDAVVGRWALGMLTLDTTWRLNFSPVASAFFVEGQGLGMPQAWNMDGLGENCGTGGFGLNIGNFAQDICIDGDLIEDSQVPPEQLFPALRDDGFIFPQDACLGPMMLSAR